mgnify:CR=1 FL=1
MKKYLAIIAAAGMLLTGCQSDKVSSPAEESSGAASAVEQETSPADTSAENTTAEEPDVTTAQPTSDSQTAQTSTSTDSLVFKPGAWRGSNEYFLFYADETGGSTRDFESGIGLPFEYEYGEENIIFHMGAADDNTIAVPSDISEESVTLTWEDGTEENFVFISSDADGFHFYSNGELVQIAQRYYKANSPEGYVPGMAGTQNNDDGTVTIQLYDSLEDHNSTSAWYTIDRVALTGTDDMTGSAVNMSDYAEAGTAEG